MSPGGKHFVFLTNAAVAIRLFIFLSTVQPWRRTPLD